MAENDYKTKHIEQGQESMSVSPKIGDKKTKINTILLPILQLSKDQYALLNQIEGIVGTIDQEMHEFLAKISKQSLEKLANLLYKRRNVVFDQYTTYNGTLIKSLLDIDMAKTEDLEKIENLITLLADLADIQVHKNMEVMHRDHTFLHLLLRIKTIEGKNDFLENFMQINPMSQIYLLKELAKLNGSDELEFYEKKEFGPYFQSIIN